MARSSPSAPFSTTAEGASPYSASGSRAVVGAASGGNEHGHTATVQFRPRRERPLVRNTFGAVCPQGAVEVGDDEVDRCDGVPLFVCIYIRFRMVATRSSTRPLMPGSVDAQTPTRLRLDDVAPAGEEAQRGLQVPVRVGQPARHRFVTESEVLGRVGTPEDGEVEPAMSDIALRHADARERPVDDATQLFAGPHQVEVLEISVHEAWFVVGRGPSCDQLSASRHTSGRAPSVESRDRRGDPAPSNRARGVSAWIGGSAAASCCAQFARSFGSSSIRPGRRVISSAGAPACSPVGSVATRSGVGKEQDVRAVSTAAS